MQQSSDKYYYEGYIKKIQFYNTTFSPPRYYSKLTPVLLDGRSNLSAAAPLRCALCFAEERTSAVMLSGRTSCPHEWTLEFSGFLSSKDMRSRKGDAVCIDSAAEEYVGT